MGNYQCGCPVGTPDYWRDKKGRFTGSGDLLSVSTQCRQCKQVVRFTETMNNYYFTFGHGHLGFPGYVVVTAPDADKARDTMMKYYGKKWCNQLNSEDQIHPDDRYLQDTLVWPE